MTVKELKEELDCYNEDAEVIFEVDDEFEPESVTEDRYGGRTVRIRSKVKPTFIGDLQGDCYFDLSKAED